jgi:hypothetical protein
MEKCGVCPDRETCEYSEVDDEEQQEEEEIDEEELKESAQPNPWTMPEIYAAATAANCPQCNAHCSPPTAHQELTAIREAATH